MQLIYRLLLAGLLVGTMPAQAQRILLGLKGGAAIANGIGSDALRSSLRFGAHGGGLVRIKLTKHLALQGEGLYTQRGDNSTAYGRTINHRLDYVDVPLLLQYHQQDLFVEAGAQLSWLQKATPTSQNPAVTLNQLTFQEQEKSFVVGFGYQDSSGVTVGWRYIGGLSNVYRPSQISGSRQIQLRNSTAEFYLGYLFEPLDVVHGTVATGKLVFIKTPVLLFKGGKFLLYTAPVKLVQAIGRIGQPKPATPEPAPAVPVPTVPVPPLKPSPTPAPKPIP